MRLMLERRAEQSRSMAYLSPIIAITLTVIAGGIIFAARGLDPLHALFVYFVEPVTTLWSIEELIVKAAPLVLTALAAMLLREDVGWRRWLAIVHRGASTFRG